MSESSFQKLDKSIEEECNNLIPEGITRDQFLKYYENIGIGLSVLGGRFPFMLMMLKLARVMRGRVIEGKEEAPNEIKMARMVLVMLGTLLVGYELGFMVIPLLTDIISGDSESLKKILLLIISLSSIGSNIADSLYFHFSYGEKGPGISDKVKDVLGKLKKDITPEIGPIPIPANN